MAEADSTSNRLQNAPTSDSQWSQIKLLLILHSLSYGAIIACSLRQVI